MYYLTSKINKLGSLSIEVTKHHITHLVLTQIQKSTVDLFWMASSRVQMNSVLVLESIWEINENMVLSYCGEIEITAVSFHDLLAACSTIPESADRLTLPTINCGAHTGQPSETSHFVVSFIIYNGRPNPGEIIS